MTDTTEEKTNTPSAMTPERIAEIKARVEKATAGPWEAKPHDHTALGCMCIGCTDPVVGWFVDHPDAGYCSDLVAIRAGARELNDFGKPLSSCDAGPLLSYEDAEFAAEARRDVPDLLAEVERLANALAIKTEVAEGAQRVVESYAEQVERVSRDLAEAREDHAEVDRMRPVVEAATAWRALLAGPPEPYHRAQVRDLIAAIDAHDATAGGNSPVESPAAPPPLVEWYLDSVRAEALLWAANELDAQADARGESVRDYTDHLRCFTTQPGRVSAVPRPAALSPVDVPAQLPKEDHISLPKGGRVTGKVRIHIDRPTTSEE